MIRRYGLQKHRGNDFYKQLAASLLNQLATPSQEKEEYLAAILSCIDSFFNGPRAPAQLRFSQSDHAHGSQAFPGLHQQGRNCRRFCAA